MYQYTMSTVNQAKYPRTKGKCCMSKKRVIIKARNTLQRSPFIQFIRKWPLAVVYQYVKVAAFGPFTFLLLWQYSLSSTRRSSCSALWPWYFSTSNAASCSLSSRGPAGSIPLPSVLPSVQPAAVRPAAGHPGHVTLPWTGMTSKPLVLNCVCIGIKIRIICGGGYLILKANWSTEYKQKLNSALFVSLFSPPLQPMYSMLQSGTRMIGQGGGPHPQALGPPGGPQFATQGDGSQGPQQGIYG